MIPYFGYARQDRKDEGRVPITAKLVANLITRAGADRVLTMDLHAAQIQGFFDVPVDHLYAAPVLNEYFLQLRHRSVERGHRQPRRRQHQARPRPRQAHRRHAWRSSTSAGRAPTTTVQEHILGGEVEGKVALMFDDMISTAGSITGAAKVLHEHGVKEIHVGATHGVLCGPAIERLKAANLASLVVTDSIPLREDQILPQTQRADRRPAAGRGDQANPPQRIGQPAVPLADSLT